VPNQSASSHPFGELLNQYRQRKPGLSQRRLAELAGYDQAILVRMAQGKKDLTGPSGRERVVRLIETLANEGILTLVDEANGLLAAANLPPLFERQPDEARLITRLSRATATHRVRRTNLPAPLTNFVGRAQELADARALLGQARLVTLTGAGGSGKTRLAQRVAADVLLHYSDGVWYVELATLSDASLIAETVARVYGLTASSRSTFDELADLLRERHMLLVLDNCEHIIDAAADFAVRLLSECARLSILTTSREALNVDGELTWRVPPMQPDEAARLFVERAKLTRPHQPLSHEDAIVMRICQRLDGMPLALELAAARLSTMSLTDIAARLDDRFALLTEGRRGALPRHQTLLALIDWSYDLLSAPEKIVFRRLGVFVGGWTADLAADVVCGTPNQTTSTDDVRLGVSPKDVLPALTHLIRKSLVVVDDRSDETRYGYLETIRHYALDRLVEHGELDLIRRRHADAFEALAWQSERMLRSPQQLVWFHKLDREFANFRQAVAWCFASAVHEASGCSIVAGLFQFLIFAMAYLPESQRWSRLALNRMSPGMPPRVRGFLHVLPGWVDAVSVPDMIAGLRQTIRCFEEAGDDGLAAYFKVNLGQFILMASPNSSEGVQLLEDALTLVNAVQDDWVRTAILAIHAHVAAQQGDLVSAEAQYHDVVDHLRSLKNLDALTTVGHNLANMRMQMLRFEDALSPLDEAYEAALLINDSLYQMIIQSHKALAMYYQGNLPGALALAESSLAQARERLPAAHCKLGMSMLGRIYLEAGDLVRANVLTSELIAAIQHRVGVKRGWYGLAFDVVACSASAAGHAVRAAQLFGAADEEYAHVHLAAVMNEAVELDAFNGHRARYYDHGNAPYIAKARAVLGDEAYEVAYAEGRAMTLEQALELALGGDPKGLEDL
jgi:predicted ATPase